MVDDNKKAEFESNKESIKKIGDKIEVGRFCCLAQALFIKKHETCSGISKMQDKNYISEDETNKRTGSENIYESWTESQRSANILEHPEYLKTYSTVSYFLVEKYQRENWIEKFGDYLVIGEIINYDPKCAEGSEAEIMCWAGQKIENIKIYDKKTGGGEILLDNKLLKQYDEKTRKKFIDHFPNVFKEDKAIKRKLKHKTLNLT